MSLEINKNDLSFDTKQVPKYRSIFQRSITGLLTTFILFSGSIVGPTEVKAAETPEQTTSISTSYEDENQVIEIPDEYQSEVYSLCGKERETPITIGDLKKANDTFMTLSIVDDASLEWLNYVGNIEYLNMVIHTDDTSVLKDVKALRNTKDISIMSPFLTNIEINSEDFSFLRNSKSIESLTIAGSVAMDPGFLEKLTNIKKFSLQLQDGNHNYDCSKLVFLDELELYDPYTAAIYVTQEDYNLLQQNGVKVTFAHAGDLEVFKDVNKNLDEIVATLGVDKNSSDQDKLDAILCYVLDNLTYDPEIANALRDNQSADSLAKSFYEDGFLYGALEKETAICGNYTALTNALADRLGLDTYYLISSDHAWSLIEVEGKQYYVDSTWLDSSKLHKEETKNEYDSAGRLVSSTTSFTPISSADAIREGRTEELEWYMEDPSSYPKSDSQSESHIVVNLPSFFGINPQEETEETTHETSPSTEEISTEESTEPISLDNKDVELRHGNKSWIIPGAAAIGIITALGGAVALKKKKDKEARERRRRAMERGLYSDFQTSSRNDYSFMYDDLNLSTPKRPTNNSTRRRR